VGASGGVRCVRRLEQGELVSSQLSNTTASSSERIPTVSVIIPTFNEARNIPLVFAELPDVHEIIVVDGHSHDDTVAVVRSLRPDARIIMQNRRGKGNALACGFAAATGDIIVMLDADGSADPGEIQAFVDALLAGADFAKGTRFAAGGGSSDVTRLRRLGNKGLNLLVNSVYGTNYTDLCYGYNAFWRECLPLIDLRVEAVGAEDDELVWGDGFEVETLINVRIAKAELRVVEVPSYERDRVHGVSNLNAVQDGLRVLRTIGAERRRSRVAPSPILPVDDTDTSLTDSARGPSPRMVDLQATRPDTYTPTYS